MSEILSIDDLSYKLPITNGIFISILLSYSIPFFLTSNQIENYLICQSDLSILIPGLNWFKFLISRLIFFDFKNYFFALVLIIAFRNFERIYGSKKFFNYLFANFIVSTFLELTIINLLNYFEITNLNHLANGCYSYIFALFINYCKDIPKEKFDFFGISFSEKILVYFFGIHMFFTSYDVLIACLSGLLSGLICRSNAFNVCNIFKLPQSFLNVLIKFLSLILLSKNKPKESILNGATQDTRRQQYIELYEQNLLNDQLNLINQIEQNTPTTSQSSTIEQNISKLEEMGFTKEQAKASLELCSNDLRRATEHLLTENS